jgi:hypothetical protein
MKLPVTTWVVMMHHQEAGTFAPAFPTLDEAEEFSNALRATTEGFAIAEPVPMAPSTPIYSKVSEGVFVDLSGAY